MFVQAVRQVSNCGPSVVLASLCGLAALLLASCNIYDATLVAARSSAGAAANKVDVAADIVDAQAQPACVAHSETCNAADDDCDGLVDEQPDSLCNFAHAVGRCSGGGCVLDVCLPGHLNCNGSAADGCERSLEELHCGECGVPCATAGAGFEPEVDAGAGAPNPGPASAPRDHDGADRPGAPEAGTADAALPDAGCGVGAPGAHTGAGCVSRTDAGCAGSAQAVCPCQDQGQSQGLGERDPEAPKALTWQGVACDSCACDKCGERVSACFASGNAAWDLECGAVMRCYGEKNLAGECLNGDCNVAGTGACSAAVNASSQWEGEASSCSFVANPVHTPCDAGAVLRQCLRDRCGSVCNFGI